MAHKIETLDGWYRVGNNVNYQQDFIAFSVENGVVYAEFVTSMVNKPVIAMKIRADRIVRID